MADDIFPRLREHRRKCADGTAVSYFFWDGRSRGRNDVPLGKDRDKAIEAWRLCEQGIFPRNTAKELAKRLPPRALGRRRKIASTDWLETAPYLRTMFFNAERRALSAGRSFTLTPKDFLAVVKRANGLCEVSGIPFEPVADRSPFAPSLDRLDCSKGYDPGNVRLVCHVANVAMNTWGIEPVIRLAEALLRKTSV